jgi:hypothetical protein
MENEKSDFLSPGDPIIIVKKMTKKVVEEAIQAYAADEGYYLKFYSAELDTKRLDVLKNREIARSKFLDDLLEKGESIDDLEIIICEPKLFCLSYSSENTPICFIIGLYFSL